MTESPIPPPPIPFEDTSLDVNVRVAYVVTVSDSGDWHRFKCGVKNRIQEESSMYFEVVTVDDIQQGVLDKKNFNVICIPGGSAPRYAKSLGQEGMEIIQAFVKKGGGYVGICAGAFLACEGECSYECEWYGLLSCRAKEGHSGGEHRRGFTNECELVFATGCGEVLGPETSAGGQCLVQYHNGPLLEVTGGTARSVATFVTELLGEGNQYKPAMGGSSAIVAGMKERGRVVLVSPHLEASPSHGHKLRQIFRWASGVYINLSKIKIVVGNHHESVSSAN